ncbi:hypothetical protein [Silvibacterium sp.]|uniref:hypothetical protein n=1 Tax=Silvibacterium sp. TaxID=1964179 RepID=UPI0039E63A42
MIRKDSQHRRHSPRKAAYRLALASALLPASALMTPLLPAQVMQAPGTYPQQGAIAFRQQQPPTQQASQPAASATPQQPAAAAANATAPSLLTQPSQPAKVNLAAGKLSVEANNSSLTAILQQVASSSGMTINGMNKDERVFGVYGPGDPRDVLSELLEGSGYNIVMFGKTSVGTPSEITLSPRGAAPSPAMNAPHPVTNDAADDDDSTPPPQQDDNPQPPPQPAPQQNPQSNGNGARTPQQMFQELQQMRQQQQQQTTTTDQQPQ